MNPAPWTRPLSVAVLAALFAVVAPACSGSDDVTAGEESEQEKRSEESAAGEPCESDLPAAVDAPTMTFAPEGLHATSSGAPREGLVQVVGQIDSTVDDQAERIADLADQLGMDEVFAEHEDRDAEFTYSDGDTLYLVAIRQVCEGRLEMRFNEEPDPATDG